MSPIYDFPDSFDRDSDGDAALHINLSGQRPVTAWLTGLSGAGKSTLAVALQRRLLALGKACCVLDGDVCRRGLSRDLGFSPADRTENVRRAAEVARMLNDEGLIVIAAFISPYRAERSLVNSIVGAARFMEIYVSTPLAVCELRDPKGLYKRARVGEIKAFTGVDAPYEAPLAPAFAVDTSLHEPVRCVDQILAALADRAALRRAG